MQTLIRFFLAIAILPALRTAPTKAQVTTVPYQYTGGRFTLTTIFNFYTSIETDGFVGTSHHQPIVTITNTSNGRSMSTSYLSANDFVSGPEGNILVGEEVIPGRQDLKTNTGVVVVDAASLGPGPLVFQAAGISDLAGRVSQRLRNVFGGPFYSWTIRPQSIKPSLSPWKSPVGGRPVGGQPVTPITTNIHAVIISGRTDPAKVVTASTNVTLIGGIVALGKKPGSSGVPSDWASGLRIVPDDALLIGQKIPPITPNIIDVRIVKHEVIGDLMPDSSPTP